MKKIILLVLLAALLLGSAGCGKKETPSDKLRKAIDGFNEEVLNEADDASDKSDQSNIFNGMFNSKASEDTDEEGTDDGDADEEDSEEYREAAVTEAPETIGNDVLLMDSASQVFERFAEFGYEYTTVNAGEDPYTWSFEYKYLGNETIDGVETKHYSMTMVESGETTISEGWYDDTWSTVKFTDPSGELLGIDAAFAGSNLTMMTQLYCNQAVINSTFYTPGADLDETYYKLLDTRSETMDLGYGSTEVKIYDVESKFAKLILHSGYADFIDKKIIVILEQEGEDGTFSGLTVTRAIPN